MPSMADRPDLGVDLGRGLRLRSPVLVASGTFGYGFDAPLIDRGALGAIVTKGTTVRAREGNPPPRIAETASGMLNAIGLQNPGVEYVAAAYAPRWARWKLPVIVNVAGESVDDYVAIARRLTGDARSLPASSSTSPVPTWPTASSSASTRGWRESSPPRCAPPPPCP